MAAGCDAPATDPESSAGQVTTRRAVWAPIVYGRTVRADSWWRAVPSGIAHREWLGALVSAIVAGGEHLESPRFLLAHWADHWVVGVACMAAELAPELASDGSRPLYTFVGWAAPADAGSAPPQLVDFEAEFRKWAGPVYRHWVGRDWQQHPSKVREPHPSAAVPTHWPSNHEPAESVPALDELAAPEQALDETGALERVAESGAHRQVADEQGADESGAPEPIPDESGGAYRRAPDRPGVHRLAEPPDEPDTCGPPTDHAAEEPDGEQSGAEDSTDPKAARPTLTSRQSEIQIWPAADRERLWAAGLATERPFVLVVGWKGQAGIPHAAITHATADDVDAASTLPRAAGALAVAPPPPKPSAEPAAAERPASRERRIIIGSSRPTPWGGLRVPDWIPRPSIGGAKEPGVLVQLLLLDVDEVLVEHTEGGWRLPGTRLKDRESPRKASLRIASEMLQIALADVRPVAVDHVISRDDQYLAVTFLAELTEEQAMVRPTGDRHVALRRLSDPALPDPLARTARRVAEGDTDLQYDE
jgi:ADP-ribose pyrophosphatase YjhB (NUDIX family)